jgi:hypothetical protein
VRRILATPLLFFFLFAGLACGPAGPPPKSEALPPGTPPDWERVSDSQGEFTVVMPPRPARSVGEGGVTWTAKEGEAVYLVSSFGPEALKPTPAEAMHEAIGGVAKGCSGEVVEEQEVAQGSIAAVAFAVKCEKGIGAIGVARTTKAHLYLQLVAAREAGPPDERVKIFIASFRPGR